MNQRSYLADNLKKLAGLDPALAEKLSAITPSGKTAGHKSPGTPAEIVTTSPEGLKGTYRDKSGANWGKTVSLTQRGPFKHSQIILIKGMGAGGHIWEIFESASDKAVIIVIEPDAEVFRAALDLRDYSEIISSRRVYFAIGVPPISATIGMLEELYGLLTIHDFNVIPYHPEIELNPAYFAQVDKYLAQAASMAIQNLATLDYMSSLWHKNLLLNIPYIASSPGISSLFGKFAGVPAYIVSAGPSLDKNVHLLAGAKGNGLIIAVDTALKALAAGGVTPDFVMSLDAQVENYFHIRGMANLDIFLVANPILHPEAVREFAGKTFFTSYSDPMVEWTESYLGELGKNLTGGSVATAAFDFACRLGASPVILIGQDLAFTGSRTHTSGSVHSFSKETFASASADINDLNRLAMGHEMPASTVDIFGAPIETTNRMTAWRNWFETIIGKDSIKCTNATEGGGIIAGTDNRKLAEVIWRERTTQKTDTGITAKIRLLADQGRSAKVSSSILAGLEELQKTAREIKNSAARGAKLATESLAEIERIGKPLAPQQGDSVTKTLQSLADGILGAKTFWKLNQWRVESLLDKVNRMSAKMDAAPENQKLFILLSSYERLMTGFYKISTSLERYLSQAVKNLKTGSAQASATQKAR